MERRNVVQKNGVNSYAITTYARTIGGEGGIRTPVPVTRQDAFEAPPLRPLRYLSVYLALAFPARAAAVRNRQSSFGPQSAIVIRSSIGNRHSVLNRQSSFGPQSTIAIRSPIDNRHS